MSELSEEEIIKILKHVIEPADIEHMSFYEIYENYVPLPKLNEAIQGLLDLYQKEKEKDKKIKEIVDLYNNTLQCTRKYNDELANILCDLQELLEERN